MSMRTDMAVEAVELDFKYDKNVIINGLDFKKLTINEELSKKRKPVERVKKDAIFKNLSFEVEPNTTVAFVGKSGSGKSTILSLHQRMPRMLKKHSKSRCRPRNCSR